MKNDANINLNKHYEFKQCNSYFKILFYIIYLEVTK